MNVQPRPPLSTRLRPGHWLVLDSVASAGYGLAAYGLFTHKPDALALAVVGTVLVSSSIVVCRGYPVAGFAAVLVGFYLSAVVTQLGFVALVPMAYVLYRAASDCTVRTSIVVLALSLSGAVATGLPRFDHNGGIVPFGLIFITAWTIGYAVGQRQSYTQQLMRHHAGLAQIEIEQARQGVTEERVRIARELHDVVAHSMSVITVQAGYGHLVIDDKPAEARAALDAIETAGRQTLAEMRQLLGVLRSPDDGRLALEPAPGLGDLNQLVTQLETAGVAVELSIAGTPRDLPAGIELSAYRIVQESLTNVVKHAGVNAAEVAVEYRPDMLAIDVSDRGRGGTLIADKGHGLVGIRERVGLYGGSFLAGPLPDQGFRVSVTLPIADGLA